MSFRKCIKKWTLTMTAATLAFSLNILPVYTSENEYVLSNELMQEYYQCNWQEKDNYMKKELNKLLIAEVAENLEMEAPDVIYYSEEETQTHGKYYVGSDSIHINEEILYSGQYSFKAIVHELRHIWQYKRSLNPSNEQDVAFKNNYNNYTDSKDDFAAYQTQIIESDAEDYANTIYGQLILSSRK